MATSAGQTVHCVSVDGFKSETLIKQVLPKQGCLVLDGHMVFGIWLYEIN